MPTGIYIRTNEHKLKISISMLGHKHSLETKNKIKNSRWGGNYIPKPRKLKLGLWTGTHDPILQLQKKRFRNQRYKARKRNAEGSHTFEEWIELKTLYNNMCLCCKRFEPEIKLTEDHIIPLILGGTDYIWNIQPLCVSCNTKKRIRTISYLTKDMDKNYSQKGLVNIKC